MMHFLTAVVKSSWQSMSEGTGNYSGAQKSLQTWRLFYYNRQKGIKYIRKKEALAFLKLLPDILYPFKTTVYLSSALAGKHSTPGIMTMTKNCKNCGTVLHGKYCYACGQKIILPEDKKLHHLVTEFFHHFTHLDSKFLITLKKILLRPGKVTRDISEGITVPHFKLSALFLIGTIIYFLLPANFIVTTPANESFQNQIKDGEFHEWKARFAEKKSQSKKISLQELAATYDRRQHDYGKLLTLLFIPLLIPVLWVISLLVKKFNSDNSFTAYDLFVASLEINSIILYQFYLITGICIWIATSIYSSEKVTMAIFFISLAALLFLLFSFFKRAYEIKWWQALICLALVAITYIYIWNLYGLVSFLIFI